MKILHWEKNIEGSAYIKENKKNTLTPSRQKQKVICMMKDVSLISAQFNGVKKVFEPYVNIVADNGNKVEFIGVYLPSFSESCNKEICIRRATWYKKQILKSEFTINTNFFAIVEQIKLLNICKSIIKYVSKGDFHRYNQKPIDEYCFLNVSIYDDGFRCEVDYSPRAVEYKLLEYSVKKLFIMFDSLNNKGLIPEKDTHRISYRKSLFEYES
ncbi:hypothetical protein [Aliikangiella maris]|uniref:Uncharacterized protein n=2 Tax=Aliikangiella maris TaxID=3162458 RepID=A0ABV3MQT5_9GAMM